MNPVPTSIGSPFRDSADRYYKAGWKGTLPIPFKAKHPPPTGMTGRNAPYPTVEERAAWINDGVRHNICIRLAGIDEAFEVIGIDVDNYSSGDKEKHGADQLAILEQKLGVLPDTWISSARTDGHSGIRYYRVPRGMAFRGQIDKDIECIQKKHRFAVVWPSVHPTAGTYWWFPPGSDLVKSGRDDWDGSIPKVRELPLLPEAWLNYLNQEGMKAADADAIDMESSVTEVYAWVKGVFHDVDGPMCGRFAEKIAKQKADIASEPTSHDKLTKGHWNLISLAAEGHRGLDKALIEFESFWAEDVISRDKRNRDEIIQELFRSRTNAIRKIKAKIDDRIKLGAEGVWASCDVTGECGSRGSGDESGTERRMRLFDGAADGSDDGDSGTSSDNDGGDGSGSGGGDGSGFDPLGDIPTGAMDGVPDYRMNDDGNADHLIDMYTALGLGSSFRYAEGVGFIVWRNGAQPHWERDPEGDSLMREMFRKVRNRQEGYVDFCEAQLEAEIRAAETQGLPITGSGAPGPLLAARAEYRKWEKFAVASGMNRQAQNAIDNTQGRIGVAIDMAELDANYLRMGVKNGILELEQDKVTLRRAQASDLITLNTGTPYEEPSEIALQYWNEYLDTFLPNIDLRKAAQIALGHCLIGGNPEKIMIVLKGDPNTGKSTMVNAIETALGDYAATVNMSIFQNHKLNPVLANALSKRVIIISEFDEDDQLSASMVKRITGGTDKISAELKGSNVTVEGIPQFVPILATNEVPKIAGADKALQNRLYVIPFNEKPKRIQKEFSNIINSICGPAILSWLVDGYMEYRRIGSLPTPQLVTDTTEAFVSELDDVAAFVAECVRKHDQIEKDLDWKNDPDWCVTRTAMYNHFERWWEINSFQQNKKPPMPTFRKRLAALGIPGSPGSKTERVRSNPNRWWYGVKLRSLKDPASKIVNIPLNKGV